MAKVIGLGGIMFKSNDPESLADWYKAHLGVPVDPPWGATFQASEVPAKGFMAWTPFKHNSDYFQPSRASFMVNLMVDDLEGALQQVVDGGATIIGDIQRDELGAFGWFIDPDGNKVELWQPAQ